MAEEFSSAIFLTAILIRTINASEKDIWYYLALP
jgi:hypothetical protein